MFLKILQIAIPFVWFGMVGAISFIEAPLKFRAPNITLALGLGIGKIVFQMLNRIEIIFAVLMLVSLFFVPFIKFSAAEYKNRNAAGRESCDKRDSGKSRAV